MKYDELIDKEEQKLRQIEESALLSLGRLVFPEELVDPKSFEILCDSLDFSLDDEALPVIDSMNAVRMAVFSYLFAVYSDISIEIPFCLNNERENIRCEYVGDDLFEFRGFDVVHPLSGDLTVEFLKTLKQHNNRYYITKEAIFSIIEHYQLTGDAELAVSDYIHNSKTDVGLQSNFNVSFLQINELDADAQNALQGMIAQQRIDTCSIDIIKKGMINR